MCMFARFYTDRLVRAIFSIVVVVECIYEPYVFSHSIATSSAMTNLLCTTTTPHHITTILRPFFRDRLGEPVPEENFWTLWCKGRLTEADTQTIRLGATPSGLTTAHLHHPLQRKYTVIFQCMQILQTDRWTSIHLKASLPRQPK